MYANDEYMRRSRSRHWSEEKTCLVAIAGGLADDLTAIVDG
jgi:hypothetical protein